MVREAVDFGIDLGTTNSSIAVTHDDRVEIIRNNDNDELTPSVVRYLPSGTVQVGRSAFQHLRMPGAEQSTFSRFKRQMGQQEPIRVAATGSTVTPEMLAAEVLKSLRQDGDSWAGEQIQAAVITVPAMFELAQCEATQRAAAMAGIRQAPLLQEPIAAGLAYGYERQGEDGYFMVYDIGAGTFDVTVLQIRDGRLNVVGTDGDNYLGGSDWDLLIAELLIDRLTDQGFAFWDRDDPDGHELRTKMKFYSEIEKIQLSRREQIEAIFDGNLTDIDGRPIVAAVPLRRSEYEPLIRPAIDSTILIVRRLLDELHLAPGELNSVILVGGPTKTPLLRSMVEAALGIRLETRLDPMTVVASGAARYAATVPLEAERHVLPVQAKSLRVNLSYPQTSDDSIAPVGGRFEEPVTGMSVELRRADGGWMSGRIPVQDGVFQTMVPLVAGRTNVFGLKCSGPTGDRIMVDPERLTISQGLVAAQPPLPRSISVVALNAAGNQVLHVLVEKGTSLPAQGKYSFRTTRAVKAGAREDVLSVHVVEGEFNRAELNRHVGMLRIDGTQISRDLPRDTPIEITLKVDQSRSVKVSAFLPLTAQTISAVIEDQVLHLEDPYEIRQRLHTELDRVAALSEHGVDGLSRISNLAQEIERDLIAAESGESERANRAANHWKELSNEIDQFESKVEIPKLTADLQESIAITQQLVGEHGSGVQKDRLRLLRQEAETAIDNGNAKAMQAALTDLHDLRFEVLAEIPEFWVGIFEDVSERIMHFVRTPESQLLIQQGRSAMLRGDIDQLRLTCYQLWEMMPSAERGEESLADVGIRTRLL